MNKPKSALSLLLIPAALFGLHFQAAAQELYGQAGDWEITYSEDEGGTLEVCAATLSYQSGEAVIFFAGPETVTLGFLLERWVLDTREVYEVAIQYDEYGRHPGQAHRDDKGNAVLINLDFTPTLDEIYTSTNLFLHTAAGSLRFDISGAAEALEAALECRNPDAPEPAQ